MAADAAEPYGITIVLEPVGDPDTLWPLYVDAVKFAKRIARPNVRCMADTNYFLRRNEPLEVIKEDPEYCVHADTQGEGGQPGIGNRVDLHTQFFRVLRDIGYENCVSFACPWLDTSGTGSVDFRMESRKSLEYAKRIQDEVYSE
jgi:sugar phosphate isomerase/epimerase